MHSQWRLSHLVPAVFLNACALPAASAASMLAGEALVEALRHGGYVIVMRHASSPQQPPDAKTADPGNRNRERQLDEKGRAAAAAMGRALRALRIPIGEILSSPAYRALETVRLAQLGKSTPIPELGDNGRSMQASTDAQAEWLKKRAGQFPSGTNTLIVTHMPNMTRAFPEFTRNLTDGEALIFGPDGKGGTTLVARIKIEEWPRLAIQ
ncbi:MAG TPA: histidine phosphatase family protein [Bryobacteraceae bacterium]|nr:histidine phosphatase family protein [Bryobacteraceae bacterium]